MNERIKEFRFKAAEYANEQKPLGITKWNEMRDEKFAELIVKECADVGSRAMYPDSDPDYVGREIKQHFGVEE